MSPSVTESPSPTEFAFSSLWQPASMNGSLVRTAAGAQDTAQTRKFLPIMARMVLQQNCLYICHKSGSVFTPTSCSRRWGNKATPNTITTPKTNKHPPQYSPTATPRQRDSPKRCPHFLSQAKGFICTGGLCKLLKWMFKFGGPNHNFLETEHLSL